MGAPQQVRPLTRTLTTLRVERTFLTVSLDDFLRLVACFFIFTSIATVPSLGVTVSCMDTRFIIAAITMAVGKVKKVRRSKFYRQFDNFCRKVAGNACKLFIRSRIYRNCETF